MTRSTSSRFFLRPIFSNVCLVLLGLFVRILRNFRQKVPSNSSIWGDEVLFVSIFDCDLCGISRGIDAERRKPASTKKPVLIICNPGRSGGGRGSRIYRDTEIPQKIATSSQLFLNFSRLFSNFCSIPAITYIFPPSRKKSAKFSTKNHIFAERSATFCKNPKI